MDALDLKILVSILLYIFIVVGVSGNIVSVIIWTNGPRCSKTSFSFYFKILAVSDIFILLVPGTEFLLFYNPFEAVSYRNTNNSMCRFFNFCINFGFEFSAWITVILTAERSIVLCLPYRLHKPSRKLTICRFSTVLAIILVLIAVNMTYIMDMEVFDIDINRTDGEDNKICYFSTDSSEYLYKVTVQCFHVGIPVPITIICNVIMIVKLCRGKKLTKVTNEVRNKAIKHLTILTICIGIVHCLSTLPETFFWFGVIPAGSNADVLGNACLYLNNAVHCFLYCLVGTDFRQDLKCFCKLQINKCCRGDNQAFEMFTQSDAQSQDGREAGKECEAPAVENPRNVPLENLKDKI